MGAAGKLGTSGEGGHVKASTTLHTNGFVPRAAAMRSLFPALSVRVRCCGGLFELPSCLFYTI